MRLQNCVTYNGQLCELLIQIENFRFYKYIDRDGKRKLLFAKEDNALIEFEYTTIGFTAEKLETEAPWYK